MGDSCCRSVVDRYFSGNGEALHSEPRRSHMQCGIVYGPIELATTDIEVETLGSKTRALGMRGKLKSTIELRGFQPHV